MSASAIHDRSRPAFDRANAIACVAVAALVLASAWFGIWLTREAGRVAAVWLANAIVLSFLLTSARSQWGPILLSALAGNVAAAYAAGDALPVALALCLCNTVEIGLAALIIRWRGGVLVSTDAGSLLRAAVASVIIGPALAAACASVILSAISPGSPPSAFWFSWFAADALGMLILLPLLIKSREIGFAEIARKLSAPRMLVILALVAGATVTVFSQSSYPFLFLVLPPLVLAAFQLGFVGVAASIVLASAIAILLTVEGYGPLMLIEGTSATRILMLQVFLASAVLLTLPIAAILDEKVRLTRELISAKALAESASAAKSDFLATMSHEIRTPLSAITGFTQLLLERGDVPRAASRHIQLIDQASTALIAVIDDILDFTRIESGKVVLNSRPLAILAMVDNCVSILRGAATLKGLDLKIDVAPDVPRYVLGDEARLRQILLNLLNNAIKFTPQGSIEISVKVVEDPDQPDLIRFAVSDTGIGIAPDSRERLFQRFTQADSSTSRRFGGTGLGLAICKQLVGLMDGAIDVSSAVGKGSTFWFIVPLPVVALHHLEDADSELRAATKAARILLAEDHVFNQEIAISMLATAGYEVDVVSDGQAAIEAVLNRPYDVVLMDIQMPGVDGVTATSRIRALDGEQSAVPIVALTANVFASEIARFRQAGFDAHLGKPFRRAELLDIVAHTLSNAAARTRLAQHHGSKNRA